MAVAWNRTAVLRLPSLLLLSCFGLVTAADALLAAEARPPLPCPDRITVAEDAPTGVARILIRAENGMVTGEDVLRGLAQVEGVDDSLLTGIGDDWSFDLNDLRTRLSLAGFNLVLSPKLRLDVERSDEGVMQLVVTIDRRELRKARNEATSQVRQWLLSGEPAKREVASDFGLRLDDGWKKRDRELPLVVLLHGIHQRPQDAEPLLDAVRAAGYPCGVFAYPNDQPIDDSADLLRTTLEEFAESHADRRVVLIGYSLGALVARGAIEDRRFTIDVVERAVLAAPPNGGSRLAPLAYGWDLWQTLRGAADRTRSELMRDAVEDGLGEAVPDLWPNSTLLAHWNSRPRSAKVKYTVVLGNRGPFSRAQRAALVALLRRRNTSGSAGSARGLAGWLARTDELVSGEGDGGVALVRGALAGVDDVVVLPLSHGDFVRRDRSGAVAEFDKLVLERLRDRTPIQPAPVHEGGESK